MSVRPVAVAILLATVAAPLGAVEYRATAPDPAAQFAAMLDLYDTVCLRAFPDDAAVATAMARRAATPLDVAGVQAILHDDPGQGWTLVAGGATFTVTIEYPPYHACAVRTMTARGFPDLAPYRALLARYRAGRGAFRASPPIRMTVDGIDTTLRGEMGVTPDGVHENLIDASGRVADPKLRTAGQDAIEVRFVHQFVKPADPNAS